MKYEGNKVSGVKIAYIGGGSRGWAWGLMSDLAAAEDMSGEVALYDIDREAAARNEVIGNRMNGLPQARSAWNYHAANSLGAALDGADFVVISILPGTFDEMESDVHAPEAYGIYQPVGDTTGPGGLFRALRTALGDLPIVAEDLGELFDSVRELLAESTFPGMKVLQFALDGTDNEYLPHNYPRNSVCYPGTHDNDTLKGWWETGATLQQQEQLTGYLALTEQEGILRGILRGVLASPSLLAIIPMADWLGLGSEARMNTPGKAAGNWQWRAADNALTTELAAEIRAMTARYFRTRPVKKPAAKAPDATADKAPDAAAKPANSAAVPADKGSAQAGTPVAPAAGELKKLQRNAPKSPEIDE